MATFRMIGFEGADEADIKRKFEEFHHTEHFRLMREKRAKKLEELGWATAINEALLAEAKKLGRAFESKLHQTRGSGKRAGWGKDNVFDGVCKRLSKAYPGCKLPAYRTIIRHADKLKRAGRL